MSSVLIDRNAAKKVESIFEHPDKLNCMNFCAAYKTNIFERKGLLLTLIC